jgi:dTDP-4-dehydrorhamnose reductase
MRIMIVGGSGQLGQDLQRVLADHEVIAPDHSSLDVTQEPQVMRCVTDLRPEVLINTSAFHIVPRCETEPEAAFRVNALGAWYLARACSVAGSRMMQISTDYVFNGEKRAPYIEEDLPAPLSVYGATKLAGEHLVRAAQPRSWIVRTAGLFGIHPCRAKPGGRNFVETVLHLAREKDEVPVVADQWSCPTSTRDLASQIAELIEGDAPSGVYHLVNGPGCTWFEFAQMIFVMEGINAKVVSVTSDHFPGPGKRPSDSRLTTSRTQWNRYMHPLPEALTEYLEERQR